MNKFWHRTAISNAGDQTLVFVIPVTSSPTPHPLRPFRETQKAMADYERSSQSAYRSYKHPGERTSDWVSRLPPKHAAQQFVDPTMPPSDTESAIYSSDSDAESHRSVPPRFVLRFPNGREERVSDGHHSNTSVSMRNARSRANSGPVNNYGPPSSHHSRSLSLHPTTGHPQMHHRVSGHPTRPHTSNAMRPEEIRIRPPQRSMTPGIAGYASSRSAQPHHPRASSVLAPTPRRVYGSGDHDPSDSPRHSPRDSWVQRHGPPQAIVYSNSHPPSKYDMPSRDYSANGYRPHASSKLSGRPISLLTKENTIANSHSRIISRGIIEDNWSVIDEDEEWEKEQQRAAYRRGRTSSQSSNSPTLTHSRSRTTSSSSRSNHYVPGLKPQMSVSFVFPHK